MSKVRLYNHNIWGWTVGDRLHVINALIRREDADICTMQEFNPVNVRGASIPLQDLLDDTYAEACKKLSPTTHLAVFYKRDRFDEVDSGLHLFDGKNDSNSKGVMWAVLKDKNTSELIGVASTHFWWEFKEEQDEIQRVQNATDLYNVISKVKEKYDIPFVIAGDLNSGIIAPQRADGYEQMLRLGLKDVRHIAKVSTDTLTLHDYPTMQDDGTYTPGPMPNEIIDHAFVTADYDKQIDKFSVLVDDDARRTSDHCPLIVDYNI